MRDVRRITQCGTLSGISGLHKLCTTQQSEEHHMGYRSRRKFSPVQSLQGGVTRQAAKSGVGESHVGRRCSRSHPPPTQSEEGSLRRRGESSRAAQESGSPVGDTLQSSITRGQIPGRQGVGGDGLRFLQANLQHGRAATALAAAYIQEQGFDIALISEPYIKDGRISSFPSHWTSLLSSRNDAAIALTSSKGNPRLVSTGPHHVTIELQLESGYLRVTSVYAPPSEDFLSVLTSLRTDQDPKWTQWLLAGDLNAHSQVWGCRRDDDRGATLLEYAAVNWLFLANEPEAGSTYSSYGMASSPDVTLATPNILHRIHDWRIPEDDTGSDHNYVTFLLTDKLCHQAGRLRFKSKHGGHSKLLDHLSAVKVELLQLLLAVTDEISLDVFTRELQRQIRLGCERAYRKVTPSSVATIKWWTPALQIQRRKVRACRRRFQKAPEDQRRSFYGIYQKERAAFKRAILKAKRFAWRRFCHETDERWGAAFRFAFDKVRKRSLPFSQNGGLRDLLSRIFPRAAPVLMADDPVPSASTEEPAITSSELLHVIHSLKKNKAPGPDGIDANILQVIATTHLDLLLAFFQKCFDLQHFPVSLKEGYVELLEKQGAQPGTPEGYRPICLLSSLGKTLEKLTIQRIEFHLESSCPLNPLQFGFRRGISTDNAIQHLVAAIREARQAGDYCVVICFDIVKAFDNLSWDIILQKLRDRRVPSTLSKVTSSFLKDRVILLPEGNLPIQKGCPQGSCYGPLLWNLVADDILQRLRLPKVMLQAFADDFVMVVSGSSRRDLEARCTQAIGEFVDWVRSSNLELADHKTVALVFGPLSRPPTLKCGDLRIKVADTVRYLGVVLDNKLNWIPHVKRLRQMTLLASHRLMRMQGGSWGLAPDLLRNWYKAVIERRLVYGAAVWAPTANSHVWRHLESTQRIFLLLITRAYRSTSTPALQVLAGIPPLQLTAQKEADVSCFLRLGMDRSPFLRQDFESNLHCYEVHPAKAHLDFTLEDSRLTIFTDGSKSELGTAAAFVVYCEDAIIDQWARKLSLDNTIFQAELLAITCAVDWAAHSTFQDCIIYTDSEACIKAVTNVRHPSVAVRKVQRLLRHAPCRIALRWIRAHVGYIGNEIADLLARRAVADHTTLDFHVPKPASLYRKSRHRALMTDWQQRWNTSLKGRGLHDFIPHVALELQVVERPLVILFSGHGPFPAHLARHQRISSDLCICGSVGTRYHYITECPHTSQWHLRAPSPQHLMAWRTSLVTTPSTRSRLMGLMTYLMRHEKELRSPSPDGSSNRTPGLAPAIALEQR